MNKKGQSNVVTATVDTQIKKVVWTEKMLEDYLDICITEIHVVTAQEYISIKYDGKM
jgi:hypothetical protein